MSPLVAAVLCICGIVALFVLDRDRNARTSWALLFPSMWLLISGSRHVSEWLGVAPAMTQERYMEGSPLDATIYALLTGAAIIVLLARWRLVAGLLQKNWPILIFVLYCALSITWSDYPLVAFKRSIKAVGDYSMILIVLTDEDRARAIKQVLARVAFVLIPVSILLIKYFPDWGRAYATHWEGTQFFVGVTDNKNMLGMVCMVFGFAACWRVLQALRGSRRGRIKTLIVHGTLLAMALWLLILCDSKTSLSCLVLTSTLITAHTFLKVAQKRVVLNMLVVAVVLSCFSVLFLGIGSDALQTIDRNSSLTGRTEIWNILLTVPINPVVGTGFESFWLGKRMQYLWSFPIVYGLNQAHNGYFELYLNLGWIGLGLFAVLLWIGYRNILRLLDSDPEAGRLRLGFFIIAVIYNFTEAGIRTSDLVWIAFVLATLAVPERRLRRVPLAKTRPAAASPAELQAAVG